MKKLILDDLDIRNRMKELFTELKKDESLAKKYLADPIGVAFNSTSRSFDSLPTSIKKKIQGLSERQISVANKYLYNVIANPRFFKWAKRYQRKLLKEVKDLDLDSKKGAELKLEIMEDFVKAMIRYGDLPNFAELVRDSQLQSRSLSIEDIFFEEVVVAVAAVVLFIVVLTQIDATPYTSSYSRSKLNITGSDLRSISEHLVKHAQSVRKEGL